MKGLPVEIDANAAGRRLSTAMVMFHEAVAAARGLSAVDNKALAHIDADGPLTAGALADALAMKPSAVTALVDRLERAGFVTRHPDPQDRRRVLVAAVSKPDPRVDAAFADLGRAMAEVMAAYAEGERAAILDYVNRTTEVLIEQTRRLGGAAEPGR